MNIINEAAMIIMVSLMTQFGADNKIKINQAELWCLSQNIYFEARAESYSGKQAVANVTRNRVKSSAHPDTYCGVVKEGPVRESWKTAKDKTLDKSKRIYYPRAQMPILLVV
jgi:spore germination cell wall hydrolase CwlJ-like protein